MKMRQSLVNHVLIILQKICLEKGFMAGVQIDEHTLMFAVTEQRTKEEIDELVNIISSITSTK